MTKLFCPLFCGALCGCSAKTYQGLVRSEALLSGAVLVAAPVLLRSWARTEAEHHDTLECRNVLQTYIIAASGWTCAMLAAVAGNPVSAVVLQVHMRKSVTCGRVGGGEVT